MGSLLTRQNKISIKSEDDAVAAQRLQTATSPNWRAKYICSSLLHLTCRLLVLTEAITWPVGVFNVSRCLSGLFKHQWWRKRDGSSPLYSLLSLSELEWKSCFYKLMTSAAHRNIRQTSRDRALRVVCWEPSEPRQRLCPLDSFTATTGGSKDISLVFWECKNIRNVQK